LSFSEQDRKYKKIQIKTDKNIYLFLRLFVHMAKEKPKNYPNVRVSPETFEILGYLKEERGSSYDAVIRDMLSEFAPFLVDTVSDRNNPNVTYMGDREMIIRHNILLGAKSAYAEYWLRVKRQHEDEIGAIRLMSETQSTVHKKDNPRSSKAKK
jgi:hypothetical protein